MMAQKQLLHELLKEDQEPFLLKNYISDRLTQMKRPNNSPSKTSTSSLQVKKQKQVPINYHQNSTFPINLCKNACFLSFHSTTPDIRKSPLFEITSSPAKSPSRTAAFLLEAALRINQKESKVKAKDKSNNRFGLYFGSLLKRLTQRGKNRKRGVIEGNNSNNNNINVKVKDLLRFDTSSNGKKKKEEEENDDVVCNYEKGIKDVVVVTGVCSCEVGFTCSSSSGVWSESNEDNKSLDMETLSTSGQSYESAEEIKGNPGCVCFVDDSNSAFFCESPFRFVLQRSPSVSSSRQTPEFSSPASSPSRHRTEDKESNGADSLNKFQSGEEEEEKEQCSPVSVLDPPFEDDDDVHENEEEVDGFDMDCSYANVQRTKQQLLYKLHRFEKLAALDPLELEKRMLDQEHDEHESFIEEDECEGDDDDSEALCEEKELREIVLEVLCHSSIHDKPQVSEDLRRIIYDLITEEEGELNSSEDRDMVIRRVCRKLELWKEVESNTIDMMIEEDFSREEIGWKKNGGQIRELAGELELAIFSFLVEEFSEEFLC